MELKKNTYLLMALAVVIIAILIFIMKGDIIEDNTTLPTLIENNSGPIAVREKEQQYNKQLEVSYSSKKSTSPQSQTELDEKQISPSSNNLSRNNNNYKRHPFMESWESNDKGPSEYRHYLSSAFLITSKPQNQADLMHSILNVDDTNNTTLSRSSSAEDTFEHSSFEQFALEVLRDKSLIKAYSRTKFKILQLPQGQSRDAQLRSAKEQIAERIRKQLVNSGVIKFTN